MGSHLCRVRVVVLRGLVLDIAGTIRVSECQGEGGSDILGVRAKRGSSDHGVKVRVGVRVKGNVGVVRVVLVVMMVRGWRVNG